jgi:hypothetical protein
MRVIDGLLLMCVYVYLGHEQYTGLDYGVDATRCKAFAQI